MKNAFADYDKAVKDGTFPREENSFTMDAEVLDEVKKRIEMCTEG